VSRASRREPQKQRHGECYDEPSVGTKNERGHWLHIRTGLAAHREVDCGREKNGKKGDGNEGVAVEFHPVGRGQANLKSLRATAVPFLPPLRTAGLATRVHGVALAVPWRRREVAASAERARRRELGFREAGYGHS